MSSRKRATTSSARRSTKSPEAPASEALSRRKITLYFREALLQEARSAVLALGANGLEPSNLSRLFEAALDRELAGLRREHNRGHPFPPYRARLPGGRPRGA